MINRSLEIIFLLLFSAYYTSAQESDSDKFKRYISTDLTKESDNTELLILKNDTLIRSDRTFGIVADNKIYQDDFIYAKYLQYAYSYSGKNSKPSTKSIFQWKEKVRVYVDKSLPSTLRKKFQNHVESTYTDIPNLEIEFTRKKSESTIAMMITQDSVYGIKPGSKNYNYYLKQFPDGLPFDHIKSFPWVGYDGEKYQCLVKINYAAIANDLVTLKKMKHQFYHVITGFRTSTYGNVSSLNTYGYEHTDEVVSMDIELLKMHYHVLWDIGPKFHDFIKLTRPSYE